MTDNPLTAAQAIAEREARYHQRAIEDLQRTVRQMLEEQAKRYERQLADATAMIHDYKLVLAQRDTALADVTARAERSEAERDRLRAALAPFKELGSHYEAYRQEQLAEQEREKAEKGYTVGRLLDFTEWLERRFDAPFVLADLLRAAAALDGDDADGEAG